MLRGYDPDFHKSPQETVFHSDEPSGRFFIRIRNHAHTAAKQFRRQLYSACTVNNASRSKLDSNGRLAVIDTIVDGLKTGWNLLGKFGISASIRAGSFNRAFCNSSDCWIGFYDHSASECSIWSCGYCAVDDCGCRCTENLLNYLIVSKLICQYFSATDRVLPFIGVGFSGAWNHAWSFSSGASRFIFAFFVWLAPVAVVDRPVGAVEALSISMRIVRDNIFLTLGMLLVVMVLNMLGALFFGLGVLITGPISSFFIIYCYRKMLHQNINK